MERDEYIRTLVDFLELLPPDMIVERISGDAPPDYFIGPTWCLDKPAVLRALNAELTRRDTWQGKAFIGERGASIGERGAWSPLRNWPAACSIASSPTHIIANCEMQVANFKLGSHRASKLQFAMSTLQFAIVSQE